MTSPTREHEWLHRMVGRWSYEVEFNMGEGGSTTDKGEEIVRSVDGLWVIAEGTSLSSAGAAQSSVITLGFDPAKGRVIGTSVGMGLPNLWVYDGAFEEDGSALLLESEGPSFETEGETARYLDRLDFTDDGHRVSTYFYADRHGAWQQFMRSTYTRF